MLAFVKKLVLLWVLLMNPAYAKFNFTVDGPVNQCSDITVNWQGGKPPFSLLIAPAGGTMRNISIPSSSFSNNQGQFTTQLNVASGKKLVAAMGDATGLVSGGVSQVKTVNDSGDASCNTTEPGIGFFYQLDSDLKQCTTYPITAYAKAVQPVTILVLIPGGDATVIRPPENSNSYDWTVNLQAGTSMLFSMYDSQGNQGGVSDIRVVQLTSNTNCLSGSHPSSTGGPGPTDGSNPSNHSGVLLSGGAIAGIVIGCLAFVSLLAAAFFLWSRKRWRRNHAPLARSSSFNLAGDEPQPMSPAHQPTIDPFVMINAPGSSSTSSSLPISTPGNSKTHAISGPSQRPSTSNFILHTDIEDSMTPDDSGPIELPPQYSERRRPLARIDMSTETQSQPGSNVTRREKRL